MDLPPVFARKNSLLWFCVLLADLGKYLIVNYLYRCNILYYSVFLYECNKIQYWATYFHHRVGGSIPIVWAYFGEFQPKSKRGMMLSCLATFWMVGNVTVAGIICYINSLSWNTWNKIFIFVKIKIFQSYVFHLNHSCSLGCDSTRNWYNNRALLI